MFRRSAGLGLSLFLAMGSLGVGSPGARLSAEEIKEKSLVAESYVAERAWVWQRRLKLENWKLELKLVPASELKPRTLGNVHWDLNTKQATIRIMQVRDYRMPFPDMLRDMEFTVVHEMIHLQLASLPRSEASRRAEESAVNQITDALIQLDRKR